MRALRYEAPQVMVMRELEAPVAGRGQVLVRVAYSGICGSELSGFLGQNSLRRPPLVFGHELSGWVEAVGDDVAADLAVGTPVTANPLQSCGRCEFCVTGRQQLCSRRLLLGASLPGSNAELVAVAAECVLPLPASMSLRDAALAEPAACAVRVGELARGGPSSSALVAGAGPIGLLVLQVLVAHGVPECYVMDLNPDRLARAAGLGATPLPAGAGLADALAQATGGRGVDVAVDAVGAAATRRDCVASVVPGGRVLLIGLHTDETSLPLNTVVRSEITLQGVFSYSTANFRTAVAWLAAGRLGLSEGVVEAPLEDGPDWYARLVAGHGAAKVLLRPGDAAPPDAAAEGAA